MQQCACTTVGTAVAPVQLVRCSVQPTGTGARGRPRACPAERGAHPQAAAAQTFELAPTWWMEIKEQTKSEGALQWIV